MDESTKDRQRIYRLENRVDQVETRLDKLETRAVAMERAIGQLGAAYIALSGANKFASDQARKIHIGLHTPEVREAFEKTLREMDADLEWFERRRKAAAEVLDLDSAPPIIGPEARD